MVFGLTVIISLANNPAMVSVLFNILRISPSVTIPIILFSSTTAVTPNRFSDISTITSLRLEFGATMGLCCLSKISLTRNNKLLPKAPPG